MILNSPIISGSLTVTGNIIASGSITLSGSVASASYAASASNASAAQTASFVALAQSASYVLTAQTASFVALAQSASNAVSAATASFVALAQSASNAVSAATASFANAFTVASTLTAQTLVVQTITSSVDFVTGSTRFGSILGNTHVFTGSVLVSGSVTSQGGFILGNSATIAPTGSIGYNNAIGVFIYGKSGSEADFRLYNRDGLTAMSVVAGTQNVHFNGNVGIGTSNIPAEANLSLGAKSTLEGGQLILQRGTSQVSASHLDNYQNQFRVMSGTDTDSNTVRMSVDMTNGSTTFYGSVTSPSLYGNSYSQTSASGTTSFVNTGIFYNTSLTGFFNNGTYLLAITGNPNGAGSSEYRGVYVGYIFITTGYDFGISSVVQRINYTQLVTGDPLNIGALTISAVFWNGTTETTQQTHATTNNQIRIKISGYNSSNIGAAQVVTLTKVI